MTLVDPYAQSLPPELLDQGESETEQVPPAEPAGEPEPEEDAPSPPAPGPTEEEPSGE